MWWLRKKDRNKSDDRYTERDKYQQFYQSSAWKRLRLQRLANNPWCECCLNGCSHLFDNPDRQEIITPAYCVDHIVPLQLDITLALDYDNTQSLCPICHSVKTMTIDYKLKIDYQIEKNMNILNDFDNLIVSGTTE